jgi:tetratricopeptide (TPR) repeat protein
MALPHLRRAVQLAPHDPNVHNYMAIAYEAMGFWESSLFERDKAIERDPLLIGIRAGAIPLLMRLGRAAEVQQIMGMIEEGSPWWKLAQGHFYFFTGDPKRAEAVLVQTGPSDQMRSYLDVLMLLAKAAQGSPEIAKRAVKELATPERHRSPNLILLVALAGDKNLLVDQIAKHAYVRNYRWLVSEPLIRPYRSDPAFQRLAHLLYDEWRQNLKEIGPLLPVQPPKLLETDVLLSSR